MPQLANVVLTDRATTPVNHTFTPENIVGNVGYLVESSGVPIGDRRFSVTQGKTATRYKPKLQLTLPVVQDQTVNGITSPTVVRTAYVDVQFNFDPKSTPQERKDAVGMIYSSLAAGKAVIEDVVVNLQGVF